MIKVSVKFLKSSQEGEFWAISINIKTHTSGEVLPGMILLVVQKMKIQIRKLLFYKYLWPLTGKTTYIHFSKWKSDCRLWYDKLQVFFQIKLFKKTDFNWENDSKIWRRKINKNCQILPLRIVKRLNGTRKIMKSLKMISEKALRYVHWNMFSENFSLNNPVFYQDNKERLAKRKARTRSKNFHNL